MLFNQDHGISRGILGRGDLGDRLDRRQEAMTADDLDRWINYLLEGSA